MKIPTSCSTCRIEKSEPGTVYYQSDMLDSCCCELTCQSGHKTNVVISNPKFELLFEFGVNAILDGYYREAVSSFSAALERFFEFYLRIVTRKRGLDEDAFGNVWKIVKNQSERQLGAYVMVYTLLNASPPPVLRSKDSGFRNDVIHKGKIPSKDEAVRFGEKIIELIGPVLKELKRSNAPEIRKAVFEQISVASRQAIDVGTRSTLNLATIIGVQNSDEREIPGIADWLQTTIRMRQLVARDFS